MDFNINIVYKIFSWIKGKIFWRNSNIVYINSNKKKFCKDDIDSKTGTRKVKWLNCESNTKLGYKFYKYHFIKMRKRLYDITRNCDEKCNITYSGFVSPMFAAFDGYCLGDNRNYTFIDIDSDDSKAYKIDYKKKIKNYDNIEICNPNINILISSSYDINCDIVSDGQNIIFNKKSGSKVTTNYLNDVYNFTKTVLDKSLFYGVKSVNLYIAAKQPVSFVVGTAIQSYHPIVRIYEFSKGRYTGCIIIQDAKLEGKEW